MATKQNEKKKKKKSRTTKPISLYGQLSGNKSRSWLFSSRSLAKGDDCLLGLINRKALADPQGSGEAG